jgi:hypothetical protein
MWFKIRIVKHWSNSGITSDQEDFISESFLSFFTEFARLSLPYFSKFKQG